MDPGSAAHRHSASTTRGERAYGAAQHPGHAFLILASQEEHDTWLRAPWG
jgi:hypothetical protein